MIEDEQLLRDICGSARRALDGQTPSTLRAYSFAIDHSTGLILLRAHFAEEPSETDLEDISVVDTEIYSDFPDHFETKTDTEVVSSGKNLSFLPGGIAYLREGEPGTSCSWK